MPKYLSNTTFFSDNLGTYIANGEIETNKLTTNGDIILTGSIINGSNSITFTENTLYTNIEENFFIHGTGLIQYQGVNYNIGQVLAAFVGGGTIAPYPSITYNSSLNTTTFTGLLVFPATSIASTSINNTTFVDLTTAQNISNKTFTGTTIFSSIQLNDNLIVNSGGTTILNSNLALINFLSGTSSNINTNISALQTKTTNMSFASNTTTFTGTMVFPTASISFNAIVGIACTLGQNQTITGTKTFSSVQNFTSNLRLDGSLLVGTAGAISITNAQLQLIPNISTLNTKTTNISFASNITTISNTLNLTDINFTGNINTFTKAQFDNAINFSKSATSDLQNQISSINTNLGNYALETEVQSILDNKIGTMIYYEPTDFNIFKNIASLGEIQYTDANNTKINIVPIITSSQDKLLNVTRTTEYNYFDINSNVHIFNNLILGNIQNVESLINAAMTEATAGLTAALIADGLAVAAGGVAAGAASTAAGAATAVEDLALVVEDHTENLIALNNKTSQISYNSGTDRTTINQTLYSPYLEIGNLESGFNQTANEQITLAGLLRCNNRVEINNTLELVNNNSIIVEGIINQDNATPPNDGVNQFLAPTNFNGNVIITNTSTTINANTTQIGTNAIANFNCNATASFGGDITMLSNKNLRLKNIVPILLDDIYFGGEAGVHTTDDVVFNMKIIANQPLQINNTCQIGTTISRNTFNAYTTTAVLDANTGMTLTTPVIGITSPSVTIGQNGVTAITLNGSIVQIGQVVGINYLYGNTYVQNLFSTTGIIGAVGNVFQQF